MKSVSLNFLKNYRKQGCFCVHKPKQAAEFVHCMESVSIAVSVMHSSINIGKANGS